MIEKIRWYLIPKDARIFEISMASSARILTVISQNNEFHIVALVPLHYEDINRKFRMAGIGDSVGEGEDILGYIDTFLSEDKPLCLFEITNKT